MRSKHFEDPFLKIIPVLDVHGETSDTVTLLIKDYITVNQKLGKNKVAVIHGRSSGILKGAIHAYLKTDKRVRTYYIYSENDGITIIEIKPQVMML